MTELLCEWLKPSLDELGNKGVMITVTAGDSCASVDLDCEKFVGTICFWEPNTFEFQFNDSSDGNVIFLETVTPGSASEVSDFFERVICKLGIN